jgi:hypothetical protein
VITLRHNVGQVRERFERFAIGLKAVPEKSVSPEYWLPLAKREAEKILQVVADPKKHYLIPSFVDTVMVVAFGTPEGASMVWTMERVREVAVNLAMLTPEQREDIWRRRRALIDRDTVAEWVATQKEKTARDIGQDNEEITDRLLAILFGPEDPQRDNAAWSLLFGTPGSKHEGTHLLEFHTGFLEQLMFEDEIALWLKAVLHAWRELILERLPVLIRQNIRAAWRESKA